LAVLEEYPTPYLRDSTPAWSVRGTTRAVLDSFAGGARSALLHSLDSFGRLSGEVGAELGEAVAQWSSSEVRALELPKGARGLLLNLDSLLNLGVGDRLAKVASVIEEIRRAWNPAAAAAIMAARAESKPCAVGEIPESRLDDYGWLLFERGLVVALDGFLSSRRHGHYHTSEGPAVNRKAIRHLYENIQACAKPSFSGGLTQELGYLHMEGPPCRSLVVYDTTAHPGVNFKDMRNSIVDIVRREWM